MSNYAYSLHASSGTASSDSSVETQRFRETLSTHRTPLPCSLSLSHPLHTAALFPITILKLLFAWSLKIPSGIGGKKTLISKDKMKDRRVTRASYAHVA